MPFDTLLADRVREWLAQFPQLIIEEKKMFSGVAFLVNGKMCINISGNNLMCRFDPALHDEVAERRGFQMMMMRGKEMNGFCFVEPVGFRAQKDFEYWMGICLEFNGRAKASKKKAKVKSQK
jgi:hypothetical protein